MKNKEIDLLRTLIKNLREPQALPYSSNPEFESGCDYGREDASDQLEWLLDELVKLKEKGKK